ncbi:MAG: recombinase family protein [Firmicutes bacterium]|nr:recombinase family protein [Bacillota bacterium]
MKNAVIYARYSPGGNQTYQSIEGQLAECREFARRSGLSITQEYIDCALTGTNDKRTEFLRMIEDSKRKGWQYIIVYQLDRFARNRYDSATYKSKLKKNGVRVLSARENITEDASGILIEGVLESMAEYYSAELSQKIKRGISISASKCKYFGGSVPLGYKIDEQKNYVINDETAPIVKALFTMLATGQNYAQIGRYLNERGILTSQGGKWNKNSFASIFSNRRYLGKYIYQGNEVDGGIPRIIDDELFAAVQRVLAIYAQAPARGKAKIEYLLSEKLLCGCCGRKMTGISSTSKSKKIHHYYKCVGVTKGVCGKRPVRKQFIEDEIIKAVVYLLTDEFIDLIAAETYLLIQAENNDAEIKRLESLIADNQKAINNLMQALMLGRITDTIMAQIEKLEDENKELKDTIAAERALQINYTYKDIRKWLLHFRALDYSKVKNRRDLIDTLIYKIILYEDKVKILFHLKGGQQKGELLLNLIFPDYPDGCGGSGRGSGGVAPEIEKESTGEVLSNSLGCAYTPVVVEFAGVYSDEGISGKSLKRRKAFNEMVEHAKAGKIKIIFVKSVSRFGRNFMDVLKTVRELRDEYGVIVYFEEEDLHSDDPLADTMLSLRAMVAEQELKDMSENQKWAVRRRFRKGIQTYKGRFYGYSFVDDPFGGKRLVPIPHEAEAVRLMYSLYLDGLTVLAIAKELSSRGIVTPYGKRIWATNTIADMLSNEKYTGDALLQKYCSENYKQFRNKGDNPDAPLVFVEDCHEAIIDKATFQRAQSEMARRRNPKLAGRKQEYNDFRGLIRCGLCETSFRHKMYQYRGKGLYGLLACGKFLTKGKAACNSRAIKESVLQELFVSAFNEFVGADSKNDSIRELEEKVKALRARDTELYGLLQKGYVSRLGFIAEHEAVKREITALEKEIAARSEDNIYKAFKKKISEYDGAMVGRFLKEAIVREWTVAFVFKNGVTVTRPYTNGTSGNKVGWQQRVAAANKKVEEKT